MNASSKKMAQAILDTQKANKLAPAWGTFEHAALLTNRALEIVEQECGKLDIDDDSRKALKKAMREAFIEDGLGGNSSQFRQKLVKLEMLPESAEAARPDYD